MRLGRDLGGWRDRGSFPGIYSVAVFCNSSSMAYVRNVAIASWIVLAMALVWISDHGGGVLCGPACQEF